MVLHNSNFIYQDCPDTRKLELSDAWNPDTRTIDSWGGLDLSCSFEATYNEATTYYWYDLDGGQPGNGHDSPITCLFCCPVRSWPEPLLTYYLNLLENDRVKTYLRWQIILDFVKKVTNIGLMTSCHQYIKSCSYLTWPEGPPRPQSLLLCDFCKLWTPMQALTAHSFWAPSARQGTSLSLLDWSETPLTPRRHQLPGFQASLQPSLLYIWSFFRVMGSHSRVWYVCWVPLLLHC